MSLPENIITIMVWEVGKQPPTPLLIERINSVMRDYRLYQIKLFHYGNICRVKGVYIFE